MLAPNILQYDQLFRIKIIYTVVPELIPKRKKKRIMLNCKPRYAMGFHEPKDPKMVGIVPANITKLLLPEYIHHSRWEFNTRNVM